MVTVHNLDHSRSFRIVWLLEEMGAPYEMVMHHRNPTTLQAPESLQKVHPLGKAPVIEDDGVVIMESGAIVQHLVEKYGSESNLIPAKESPEHIKYLQWFHYAEGSAMPPLVFNLMASTTNSKTTLLDSVLHRLITQHLTFMENQLNNQQYFVGDAFTAADIMMAFVVEAADGMNLPNVELGSFLTDYPNLNNYLTRIRNRPAYQTAVERC